MGTRRSQLRVLAVWAVALFACGTGMAAEAGAAGCDKVASPLGSDAFPGTAAAPYATVQRLANSLAPGQTGCLRAGVFQGDVRVTTGGAPGAPTHVTSYPAERAIVVGRFYVSDAANFVTVTGIDLDGRNDDRLPSPTINGDHVTFSDNDVTNHHSTICFLLGSDTYGRARDTVIERNRIHDCGELPATNHHHGIYVEASDGARITDNWIYDNADRGVQLFPDAQGTYIARNMIDGNGQGIIFSRRSANNTVEHNVLSHPVLRYNLEEWELTGGGNVARRNCVWSTRHAGNAGIQPGLSVALSDNRVADPAYVSRADKDFRLRADSLCRDFVAGPQPAAAKPPPAPKRRAKRRVSLSAATASVWPQGRLRLRAQVVVEEARASAAGRAVLKARRKGRWQRVGTMRLRDGRYACRPRLARRGGSRLWLGAMRVKRRARVLRLRAYVKGVGRSNIVHVRIRSRH